MDVIGVLFGILLVAFLVLLWKYTELKGRVEERAKEMFEEWRDRELESVATKKAEILFEDWKQKYEEKIRRDAIERSRAVITGKVVEQLTPYLPQFKYNPKDARFIGSPVDLIVFDGLDEGNLRKIVFIEVKSGKSSLSKREKLVKDAIEKGKVEYEILSL